MFEKYKFARIYKEVGKLVVDAARLGKPNTTWDAGSRATYYAVKRNNLVFLAYGQSAYSINWVVVYVDTLDRTAKQWYDTCKSCRSWIDNAKLLLSDTQACLSLDENIKLMPQFKGIAPKVYKLMKFTLQELQAEIGDQLTQSVNPHDMLSSILDMKLGKGETN